MDAATTRAMMSITWSESPNPSVDDPVGTRASFAEAPSSAKPLSPARPAAEPPPPAESAEPAEPAAPASAAAAGAVAKASSAEVCDPTAKRRVVEALSCCPSVVRAEKVRAAV